MTGLMVTASFLLRVIAGLDPAIQSVSTI